jgi:predicted ATPase/DNA-binding CsgD family transcriptional regulator
VSQEPLADRHQPAGNPIPKANLPAALTPLLGRERELADVRRLLSTARLVTITGPGGVGKTSLALQVARELGDAFADSAHFISLAAITDPTLIIPTLAQAVGVTESPGRLLFDSLKDFLRDRQMLLLIDNFEQVISAAPLLTELLSACSELKLLVTSRETLRVRGEQEFPVSPLQISDRALIPDRASVETLLQYPGIALFVQQAQASQPEFQLTAENGAAVAEVCARLDGLPLAIELAATRIKLLPPKAMLTRLQASSLGLLTSGARDLPARQQTLRATVQWSYDLLNDDEQRAFRTLSVFTGGCTLDSASSVYLARYSAAILDDVASLVNKNLVRQSESDGAPRLGLLETIREFGLEQLAQANELEAVRRAHAHYYLELAEETEPHLAGREQKAWLTRLGREQDNLRAALRWGFDQHAPELVLRLVGALWQFWSLRGQWTEGRRWLEEALSMASKANVAMALRARVLYAAATLMRYQYDFARARALCEQGVTLYRELGDKEGLLTALLQLCRILDFQGDSEALRALLPETFALAAELPDLLIKAQVYAELPMIGLGIIGSETAARYLADSERIYRALDNPVGLALTLSAQGGLADLQGDMARAQALRDESERLLPVEVDDPHLRIRFLSGRFVFAWQRGDASSARRYFEQIFAVTGEVGAGSGLATLFLTGERNLSLEVLAAVLHRQALSVWAARVYGLADQLAKTSETPRMGSELFEPLRQRATAVRSEVRARLGDEAFALALAEGHTMTLEDLLTIPHPSPASNSQALLAPALVPSEPLTGRELDVLRLLAQDFSNPQIAERLVVSRRTVEAHLRSIYGKFGVKSREAAIRFAREHGLVEK